MATYFFRIFFLLWTLVQFSSSLQAYQIGDFFRSLFGYSKTLNEQPTPAFSVPSKDPNQKYIQFFALGDMGTGGSDQYSIGRAMADFAKKEPVTFVLTTGDNIYEDGATSVSDPQWITKFEKAYDYPPLKVPFYAVLGNHDVHNNAQCQVDYTHHSAIWKMPAFDYSFKVPINDTSSIEFFCFDSNPLAYIKKEKIETLSDTGKEKSKLRWLDSCLNVSSARWKIVVAHHPLYSNGTHGDNETMKSLLEPLLIQHNVDLYVCGHDHNLEMLKPIHGVRHLVTGAGGKHRDITWRENTEFIHTNCGYNFIRIGVHEAVIQFFDRDGDLLYASVIRK